MVRDCLGKNEQGDPCQAKPVRASGYCYWHDPALASERARARREGGVNRSSEARARKLLTKGLQDLGDVRDILMVALLDVADGGLDPKVANAMANLAGKIKDLTIGIELEEQVADLEHRIGTIADRLG